MPSRLKDSGLEDLILSDSAPSPEESSSEIISEGDLKAFFRCPYSYYLKKYLGLTKIPRSAFGAQVLFFQQARRLLFNLKEETGRTFPYQTRGGPNLDPAEKMSPEELPKGLAVSSPETFGNLLYGRWLALTKKDVYAGSPLVWHFPAQPHFSACQLRTAGKNYYNFILQHGPPVRGFMEKIVSFPFEGKTFALKFPEIRKGLFIDDIALWGFNEDSPDTFPKTSLSTSSLVALRILAFCYIAHHFPHCRLKWGISDEIAEPWTEPALCLDGQVHYRHFSAAKNCLSETSRHPSSLDPLKKALEYFFTQTSKESFPPRSPACPSCSYNTLGLDGSVICPKRKRGEKPAVPLYYFKKKAFAVQSQETEDTFTLTGIIKKNEQVSKTVSRLILKLNPTEEKLLAASAYSSEVRGYGFEERMLQEADQQLQSLANQRNKALLHQINFKRDFQFAGQGKISQLLKQLGYQNNQKEYLPKT